MTDSKLKNLDSISPIGTALQDVEKFKVLFDSSPLPYLFFDNKGILDCNKATVEILQGKSKADILSRHPAEFSPENQPNGQISQEKSIEMDRLARQNGFHRFEWQHKTLTGKVFPVEVSMSTVQLGDQEVLLVIWRDLTEIKEKDLKLIQSSKMSSLGEMAGGVAHEINNPLSIILGKANLLLKHLRAESFTKEMGMSELQKIVDTADRIAKIVSGLRSFSRNAEKDPILPAKLSSIVTNVLSLCLERFNHQQIRIETEDIPAIAIECRSTQIEQVLLNLLNNAYDAISTFDEKWVKISFKLLDNRIQISVTDSGHGIPPENIEKLMLPFFTTKGVGKGTGLGLSISKGIVEDHDGRFQYDSSCPNTRFFIELPILQNKQRS